MKFFPIATFLEVCQDMTLGLPSKKTIKQCLCVALVGGSVLIGTLPAYARAATQKVVNVSASDLSAIRVTQYELALVQVMSEICPSMLNARQRTQFNEAYQNQLKAFMPSVSNPSDIMAYLANQRDYKAILQSVRAWTATFPPQENHDLCTEFVQKTRVF